MDDEVLNTAELIDSLDGGDFAAVLHENMRKVVKAVKETGKAGGITLKITVKPMPNFGDAVAIVPDLKTTIPQQTYKQRIMFALDDGRLITSDPNQRKFSEIESSFGKKAV